MLAGFGDDVSERLTIQDTGSRCIENQEVTNIFGYGKKMSTVNTSNALGDLFIRPALNEFGVSSPLPRFSIIDPIACFWR
jgi:hypothetical protein